MSSGERSFFDLYTQNFVRVTVAIPRVALADPSSNAAEIARLYAAAAEDGAAAVLFPELALSGYSLEDLHQQEALLRAVLDALARLVEASRARQALQEHRAQLDLVAATLLEKEVLDGEEVKRLAGLTTAASSAAPQSSNDRP